MIQPGLLPILLVALALRLVPFFVALSQPERFYTLDARGYMALAFDPVASYLRENSAEWTAGFMRTPGYPVFASVVLAMFRGSLAAVILAQIALSLGAIVLLHDIAARLFDKRVARAAALLLALDPATVVYTNLLQPESLFVVLMLAGLLRWLSALRDASPHAALLAGALIGLATLTRPIGVLLLIPLVLIAMVSQAAKRDRVTSCVLALIAFGVFVGGWMARNAHYTGVPVLSTIEGINMLGYRAAGAVAIDEDRDIEEVRRSLQNEFDRRHGAVTNPGLQSHLQSALALEILKSHPWGAVRSAIDGLAHLIGGTGLTALSGLRGDPAPETISGVGEKTLQVFFLALLITLYAAAVFGALKLARLRDLRGLVIPCVFIFYFAVMSAGPEATTRFRVPMTPFLALLAGVGFAGRPAGDPQRS